MTAFSSWRAVWFGLETVRREPAKMLLWLAALAVINILYIRDYAGWVGPMFAAQISGDPYAVMESYRGMARMYLWTPLQLALMLGVQGLMLRILVRGEAGGWGAGLQFGLDELRLLVVNIAVYLLMMAAFIIVYLAVIIGALMIGLVVSVAVAFAPPISGGGSAAVILAVIVPLLILAGIVVVLGAMAYPSLKFTPAAAATVDRKRIQIFEVWKTVPRWPWRMLGAYVILYLLCIPFWCAILFLGFLAGGGPGSFELVRTGAIVETPGGIIAMLIYGVGTSAMVCLWLGIGAYSYLVYGPPPAAAVQPAPQPDLPPG